MYSRYIYTSYTFFSGFYASILVGFWRAATDKKDITVWLRRYQIKLTILPETSNHCNIIKIQIKKKPHSYAIKRPGRDMRISLAFVLILFQLNQFQATQPNLSTINTYSVTCCIDNPLLSCIQQTHHITLYNYMHTHTESFYNSIKSILLVCLLFIRI